MKNPFSRVLMVQEEGWEGMRQRELTLLLIWWNRLKALNALKMKQELMRFQLPIKILIKSWKINGIW